MKKKLAVKLATLMCAITSLGEVATLAAPNSFLLWGEPTPPMKKKINNISKAISDFIKYNLI